MCANIKVLLRDIAFNAEYLCQYSDTGFELVIKYYWTETLKIAVTTIFTRVCPCMCVIATVVLIPT